MVIIWILIILNVFACTWTKPTGNGSKYIISTEYVHIEKISGTVFRHKRSTAILFPNTMSFRFQIEAGEVTLNLERTSNNHQATKAPIYTLEGTAIKYRNHTIKEHFALYQDLGLGGSVLVKLPGDQLIDYELMGAFSFRGNHYEITPLSVALRRKRATSTHQVQMQAMPYGNFYGDELLPPPDTAGFNMPNHYQPPFPAGNLREGSKPPLMALKEDLPNSDGEDFLTATIRYSEDADYLFPPGMVGFQYEHGRRKRESETIYIEYMVVSDYKNTENWKARVGGETDEEKLSNAFDAMYQYYQFVTNGIDVRFRSATSSGRTIRVVFASLMVSTSASTSPWITKNKLSADSVDDAGCLLDFALWKKATYSILPNHDHAALFTGYDLATPSSRSTLGMAYLNSMCAEAWSVSENEETYNAVAIHIAGHELGHNIGSRHDGSGNGCSSSSLYLMAGRLPQIYNDNVASNPWTFSTCSQTSIKNFLATLGESNCLQNEPSTSRVNDVAGLVYSADEQCNMTYGNDAVLCRDNLFYQWDTICYAMQCKEKGQSSCIGRIFPFDGTPCGHKKWCQRGLCIYSEDAPETHETCVFGDDPHSDCNAETSCSENNFFSREVTCCATCVATKTTTPIPSTSTVTTTLSSVSTNSQTASSAISTQSVTESSASFSHSSSSTTEPFTSSEPITTASTTKYSTSTTLESTPPHFTTQSSSSIPPSSGTSANYVTESSTDRQSSSVTRTAPPSQTTLTSFTFQSTNEKASTNTKSQSTSYTVNDSSAKTSQDSSTTIAFPTQETSSATLTTLTVSNGQMSSGKTSSTTRKTSSTISSTIKAESSLGTTSTRGNSDTSSPAPISSKQSQTATQGVNTSSTSPLSTHQTTPKEGTTSAAPQKTSSIYEASSTSTTYTVSSSKSSQTNYADFTYSFDSTTVQSTNDLSTTVSSKTVSQFSPGSTQTTVKVSSETSTAISSTLFSSQTSQDTSTMSTPYSSESASTGSPSSHLSTIITQTASMLPTSSERTVSTQTVSSPVSTEKTSTVSRHPPLSTHSTFPVSSSSQFSSKETSGSSSVTSHSSSTGTMSSTSITQLTSTKQTTNEHGTSPDDQTTVSPLTSSTHLSSTLNTRRTTAREQSEELSYELQTMISLFLTAAMVI